MKIGIDIDGVLTNDDDYLIDYTTKFCYEKKLDMMTFPYAYEYEKWNWDQETINQYREEYFENYIKNEPARRFASEVISKLKEEGHEIYIITGRYQSVENSADGERMRNNIKEWLKKNHIVYDELICAYAPKVEEIQSKKIEIMIEDSPSTIPIIEKLTHVFCYDARYNRNLKCDHMTRVFSWYDIYMKIQKYQQKIISNQ